MKKPTLIIKIWLMPLLLAWLSLSGLIAALLADGWGDAVSWLTLSTPIVATVMPIAGALLGRTKK